MVLVNILIEPPLALISFNFSPIWLSTLAHVDDSPLTVGFLSLAPLYKESTEAVILGVTAPLFIPKSLFPFTKIRN